MARQALEGLFAADSPHDALQHHRVSKLVFLECRVLLDLLQRRDKRLGPGADKAGGG